MAGQRYTEVAEALHLTLPPATVGEKIEKLVENIAQIKHRLCMPPSILVAGVSTDQFEKTYSVRATT